MTTEREQLIASHIYIVEAEAGKFHRKCPAIPLADHYSAGALGLIKAAEAFDPKRGMKFKTLAGWWVRGEIKHQIRAWSRHLCGIPKAQAGTIRLSSLDELRPMGLNSDGDTMLESLPDQVDVTAEVLSSLDASVLAAAVATLPADYADAVRDVLLDGQAWSTFGKDRGWSQAQTERFARRFRAEVGPLLRASRPVAELVSGGTARLPLVGGGSALVDGIDAADLVRYRWLRDPRGFGYRYETRRSRRTRILLHHAVVGAVPEGHRVIHRNQDKLDCRRGNLVVVPRWQAYHQQPARNRTGWKGIRLHAISGKWCAEITVNGEARHLGSFGSARAAAEAYDRAALELLGDWASLNFPDARKVSYSGAW